MFPTKFEDMKGILGELGVMRIPRKEGAKPVKQCPYWLNPRYKEKVRKELNKMLATGIIEPVEKSKWIIALWWCRTRKLREKSGFVWT